MIAPGAHAAKTTPTFIMEVVRFLHLILKLNREK